MTNVILQALINANEIRKADTEPKAVTADEDEAICELAEMVADQEEAIMELAELIGGMM